MKQEFFLVQEKKKAKRERFYIYLHENYQLKDTGYEKEEIVNSSVPYMLNLKTGILTVFESISCCAVASKNNVIINIEEFKKIKERRQ